MKRLIHITALALFSIISFGYSQSPDMEMDKQIMINENTIIKDEKGKKVDMMTFMNLMNSGEWMVDPKKDNNGNDYMQLRKATESEKVMIKQMSMEEEATSKLVGTKAPSFKMTDTEGNLITSENTKGKVVVLNFWFTTCKPCIMEIPELNSVYEKYKSNKNVVFASITFNKKEAVKSFLLKHPLKYPVVSNSKNTINTFGISGYPTNIVIDKKGNYSDITNGGFPEIGKHIEKTIEKAL